MKININNIYLGPPRRVPIPWNQLNYGEYQHNYTPIAVKEIRINKYRLIDGLQRLTEAKRLGYIDIEADIKILESI